MMTNLNIRSATSNDIPVILHLFDDAVRWLVSKGITKQWGTEPLSSRAGFSERVEAWVREQKMWVVCQDDVVLGCLVIASSVPAYAQKVCEKYLKEMLYLEAFVASREHKGVGKVLLEHAESLARSQDIRFIWVDCFAENPALRTYYERAGFTVFAEFSVKDWHGIVLEKPL
jgi:GNAT superfamily N-acetyltransferase